MTENDSSAAMSRSKRLIERYKPRGVMAGNELRLRHREAMQLIEDCRSEEIVILGIDFFRRESAGFRASIYYLDFTDICRSADAVDKTTELAAAKLANGFPHPNDYATFVLRDMPPH